MDAREAFLLKAIEDRVKELRITELLLTQEEMAANCGLTQYQLSLIENGKVNSKILTLRRISEGCHISLSDLFNFSLWSEKEIFYPKDERF